MDKLMDRWVKTASLTMFIISIPWTIAHYIAGNVWQIPCIISMALLILYLMMSNNKGK